MNIGIDGRSFLNNRTGIGRYVWQLCKELDKLLPDAQFFVYSHLPIEMPVTSQRWRLRVDTAPFARFMKPILWLKYRCGCLCKKDKLDVFWGAATFLPTLQNKVKKIITVYDLSYVITPNSMGILHRQAFKLYFKKDLYKADAIMTISDGTAQRLETIFNIKTSLIIKPAIDSSFKKAGDEEINECLNKYNIKRPYILAVATWEPRKNLERLVKTFQDMKKEGLVPAHTLVLVGGRGWKDSKIAAIIKNDSGMILPLGFVSDTHLAPLYSGSDLFVFPSEYEGFGMPVLEARACGAQVVTSDTPELREAGGDDAIYVTPTSHGIRNGILKALEQSGKKEEKSMLFSNWEDSGKIIANILKRETFCDC